MNTTSVQSTEYNLRIKDGLIGAQMLFVAFGALVLVPLLTGLDPNVALFTAGAGTLVFQLVTRGQVPVFLASSFAFIPPIMVGVQKWGIPATMCGLAAAGVLYVILAAVIKVFGTGVVRRVLPPVVTGPVIMVIGLVLAPVAINMAMGRSGDGALELVPQTKALIVALISLAVTLAASIRGRGMIRLIPILLGIVAGYIAGLILGIIDFSPVRDAAWLSVPAFVLPTWHWGAIINIVPVAIAPAIEHFGDVLAIGNITGKNYIEKPGIHRTMLGDGLATTMASLLGGPPNTTYSEVSGAVALTRVFNPAIMTWAACFAVALAFIGKLGAVLSTIPVPVMGGIMILLFGAITVIGINTLVKSDQDLTKPRNMSVAALILVIGIGTGAPGQQGLVIGNFSLAGIGLAGVAGVILNLILPPARKE
jgi:uracil permease